MTEKRKEELLARVMRGFAECSDGVETYRFLHDDFGITNEELVECGLDRLRKHFRYEWAEGTPQREYANMLDRLLPAPDVYTTALWMGFAEEIADGAESSFEQEANALVAAFREISKRFSPRAVETVYQAIHAPANALLSNEIIPVAEAAEQGESSQELSDMAASGIFGGGPAPTLEM